MTPDCWKYELTHGCVSKSCTDVIGSEGAVDDQTREWDGPNAKELPVAWLFGTREIEFTGQDLDASIHIPLHSFSELRHPEEEASRVFFMSSF